MTVGKTMNYFQIVMSFLIVQIFTGSTLAIAEGNNTGKAYQNELVVTEPDGTRVRMVRWAIGSRDHVVTLRIPEAYASAIMSVGCHPFGKGSVDPNCAQPYSEGLTLEALLPDFTPKPRRKLTEEEEGRSIRISIDSILIGRSGDSEADRMQIRASTRFEGLNAGPDRKGYELIVKEPRYGLNRVGLEASRSPRKEWFDDFLFSSATPFSPADLKTCPIYKPPERMGLRPNDTVLRMCRQFIEAKDFLVCRVEEMPTRYNAPKAFPGIPHCDQWFAATDISAIVIIFYERQHLKDWRTIMQQTLDFISTFKQP
jgi:hypothetical protein